MTAYRPVFIVCDDQAGDKCLTSDVSIQAVDPRQSVGRFRADLRNEGWAYRNGRDVCPECRKGR